MGLMSSTITVLKEFFDSNEIPAYLVGGYLRDSLLDLSSNDLDIAVKGHGILLGQQLANRMQGSLVTLDHDRKIARVVMPEGGGHVDISSIYGTIEEDLSRRDFTVDAMALNISDIGFPFPYDAILDPYGGRRDLSLGRIRMIKSDVFLKDGIRLLRAVRLAKILGFTIDNVTQLSIRECANMLVEVSPERVRDEFLELFRLKGAKKTLDCLDDLGLLCNIIPELEALRDVEQAGEHYWDVFEHTKQTVEAVDEVTTASGHDISVTDTLYWGPDMDSYFGEVVSDGYDRRVMLRLGALFHDIAKPQTKTVDHNDKTRFLGHPKLGSLMAENRLKLMRVGSRGIKEVCTMVEHHLRPTQMSHNLSTPTNRSVFRFYRDLGDSVYSVLYLSLADYLAARGPTLQLDDWQRRVDLANYVLAQGRSVVHQEKQKRILTGEDLINVFGLEPGPKFRTILDGLEEARILGEVNSREEGFDWVKSALGQVEKASD